MSVVQIVKNDSFEVVHDNVALASKRKGQGMQFIFHGDYSHENA